MRLEKPDNLAVSVSAILSGSLLLVTFGCIYFMNLDVHLGYVFLLCLIFGLLSFFITRYFVEAFIYQKVKLIYKSIHHSKSGRLQRENIDLDDVTQSVRAWNKIKDKEIRELKVRESYRREFIGDVSHELKTPIFNIQGYVLTLLDGALEDPDINRVYLERTNKSVERMIHIVEDMEQITRLESGALELKFNKTDLNTMVKDVFDLLEIKAQKKNMELRFNREYEKAIWVNCDKERIQQVVINLVVNAIKYGKDGGYVEIRFYDMDRNMLIEVSDNGEGIDQEHLPRLFERFYRVDKARTRQQGGSGLGLAIVKHIIEAHKQTINVRSTKEIGSTFSFTLEKAK